MARRVRNGTSSGGFEMDASHLVVILVVGVFFGFLGFLLGKSSASPGMTVTTTEAVQSLKDNGAMMRQMGAMMKEKGAAYRDTELSTNGETMEGRGVMMMDKGTDMMGKLGQ